MMSEEKRIWLLSTGEYSSYSVIALFDDEHKADGEKMAELIGGTMEEKPMLLNGFAHEELPAGKKFYSFQMYRDGSTSAVGEGCLLNDDGTRRECTYWLETNRRYEWLRRSHWRLYVSMYAESKEHAVKVANEIRAQILAGAKPDEGDIP